ncbi:MAG TPA: phosphoribosylamine--glycine ligase [Candidatus Acidoferrum sp.]|jgi:phosphoribosylamine--glycine ligase
MKILVIGGGGREHALVWKLAQNPRVERIWCAPGNAGIAQEAAECLAVDPGDVPSIVEVAGRLNPDLTVVGPELPLIHGIADAFALKGWPIVAPSQQAAQLEGSKIFAKQFLQRHGIPTPRMLGVYESSPDAIAALDRVPWPLVIKADGLCAGKGVLIATDRAAAVEFLEGALDRNELGSGGRKVMFEEAIEGDELSFIILADGEKHASLVPTRDHKRVFDGNKGPNTGGMGAYSTDELLSSSMRKTIEEQIIGPTMRGLKADGVAYRGFLYFGLMMTAAGPQVLEFNCRLGDPEAQAIMACVDFDLAEVLMDAANGRLDASKFKWRPGASVCVVAASAGYPGKFESGKEIHGLTDLQRDNGVKILHAGTKKSGDAVVTAGGRVLGVTASGESLEAALAKAYAAMDMIQFDGKQFRRDIGASSKRVDVAGA